MNISRVFGNKKVLVVLALALILIVIISLINIGKIALTGFSSLNKRYDENTQNNGSSLNSDEGNALTILVTEGGVNFTNTISNTSSNTPSNTLSGSGRTFRGTGYHSGGNSGGSSNGEDSWNINNTNQNPQNLKKRLMKKPRNLHLKMNGIEINDGEEFEGRVRLKLDNNYNQTIAAFDINFTKDIDLSDIIADTDPDSGKSFLHHTDNDSLENIDLYIPVTEGIDTIVVCPGASSYGEIYYGCANQEIFYLNETNPRLELSSDNLYYIVHNITGTGATGVNVSNLSSSRQNATAPGSLNAIAGNVTHIAVPQGSGITQAWQGYTGNVTGVIQLADSGDNVLYNWSLASPEGVVLASTNNSIIWYYIQCFNFTSTGTYEDESGNGGSTNLHGTNLTQLETQYGIKYDDIDGVDETFTLTGAGTHNAFYINANEFEEGECQNTRIIDYTGFGQDDHFEEALLYEPSTSSVVFAALLNEDVVGFDDKTHDFEMLVLENGHGTDTATTTYYFYAVIF